MVLLGLAHGQVFDGPPISLLKLLVTHESEFMPSYLDLADFDDLGSMDDSSLDCRPHENSTPTDGRV